MNQCENSGIVIRKLACVVPIPSNSLVFALPILILATGAVGGSNASKHWSVAAGSPPELQTVIDGQGSQDDRNRNLSLASDDLKDAQATLRKTKGVGHSNTEEVEKASARVAKAKTRLAGLRNGTALAWPHFSSAEIKKGLAGYWNCASTYKVFQIIDKSTAILQMQDTGFPLIWVEHFDTAEMTEDKEIYASSLMLVFTGTKTYDTAVGTKTVFVARSFGDDDFVYRK